MKYIVGLKLNECSDDVVILSQQVHIDCVQQLAIIEGAMQVQPQKWVRVFGNSTMNYFLQGETMMIEVASNQHDDIYWTALSNDTIPQNVRILFPDPKSIFQFFKESTESGEIVLPAQDRVTIVFKIGRSTRQFSIFLSKKELTKQEKLLRKVQTLQDELRKQKQKNSERLKLLDLQLQLQTKQIQMIELSARVQELQEENQQLKVAQREVKELNQSLQQKINSLESFEREVHNLNAIVASQTMIIQQLEREIKDNREIVCEITKADRSTYGTLLVFNPSPDSVNRNCFNLNDKFLTKNTTSKDGTGRMIPSSSPIPKTGRFHYKFVNRNIGEHSNFRLGVISRATLLGQAYINGGDVDGVMYYCYNKDQEIIYEGVNKMQGFNIRKGDLLTIVIDQQKKQVQWYVQNNFMNTSKYTEPMKNSQHLFFFIQLWNNGDSLQIVDR